MLFEDHPVINVTWYGAIAYCDWLSEKEGQPYRLPSEAEWEYVARGGVKSKDFLFAGGHKLKEVGWYSKNSHGQTKPVGLKQPNELGLYDMSGNVDEWCADHWHENYNGAPNDGSAWVTGGDASRRVVRGGSWYDNDESLPRLESQLVRCRFQELQYRFSSSPVLTLEFFYSFTLYSFWAAFGCPRKFLKNISITEKLNIAMEDIQQLEKIFGTTFKKQADLTALRQFHANNAYCLNEHEEVIGLCFCENKVKALEFPGDLRALSKLQYLNLSDNRSLKRLQIDTVLSELKHLDISDSGLEELKLPAGFKNLQWLDASRNQLRTVEFTGGLPALSYLDLTGNQLDFLSLHARKLEYLYLNNNKLRELEFATIPIELRVLQIKNNQLNQLPNHFLSLTSLQLLYLHENPLASIPEEVIGKGESHNAVEDVRAYLEAKERGGGEVAFLHQAKMVLVGNGEVGKTSIRLKLQDEAAPLPSDKERTPGLDLGIYEIPDLEPEITGLEDPIEFSLYIWDFGGQGKYREIQQLFCSRKTLYVFVTAHDDDLTKEDYYGFEYWLSMVHAYSFDENDMRPSPVIHVVNKIDEKVKPVNQGILLEQFGNVEEFIQISCKELTNFKELKRVIRQILPKVNKDMFSDAYPAAWIAVKEQLLQLQDNNHITYETFRKICRENDMEDQEAESWLRILHRIGSVIYFGNNTALKDWIILNPQWVKGALFSSIRQQRPDKRRHYTTTIFCNLA